VRHTFPGTEFSYSWLQAAVSKAKIIGLANAGSDTQFDQAASEFGITAAAESRALLALPHRRDALGLATAQGLIIAEAWYWDLNDCEQRFEEVAPQFKACIRHCPCRSDSAGHELSQGGEALRATPTARPSLPS